MQLPRALAARLHLQHPVQNEHKPEQGCALGRFCMARGSDSVHSTQAQRAGANRRSCTRACHHQSPLEACRGGRRDALRFKAGHVHDKVGACGRCWGDKVRRCGVDPAIAMCSLLQPSHAHWACACPGIVVRTEPSPARLPGPYAALGRDESMVPLVHTPGEAWQICRSCIATEHDSSMMMLHVPVEAERPHLRNGCDRGVLHSVHLNSPRRTLSGSPLPKLQAQTLPVRA